MLVFALFQGLASVKMCTKYKLIFNNIFLIYWENESENFWKSVKQFSKNNSKYLAFKWDFYDKTDL